MRPIVQTAVLLLAVFAGCTNPPENPNEGYEKLVAERISLSDQWHDNFVLICEAFKSGSDWQPLADKKKQIEDAQTLNLMLLEKIRPVKPNANKFVQAFSEAKKLREAEAAIETERMNKFRFNRYDEAIAVSAKQRAAKRLFIQAEEQARRLDPGDSKETN